MSIVYLNGQLIPIEEAKISVMDRGFLFSDGIYEVIPVYAGKLFRLTQHLERLQNSLNGIHLRIPQSMDQITQIMQRVIAENIKHLKTNQLAIYLQITRGAPSSRDHGFGHLDTTTNLFVNCSPLLETLVDKGEKAAGIKVVSTEDRRWSRCDIKSISLLPNVLARQFALDAGAKEAILIRDENLIEGAASNFFVVHKNILKTPPKSNLLLGGITRDLILELAEKNAIPYAEVDLPKTLLNDISEAWISSSTKEISPIIQVDNLTIGTGKIGPIWKKMATIMKQYKQNFCMESIHTENTPKA